MTNREIFEFLINVGKMTDEGACGLMGNFMAESGMRSTNVEDRSGINDYEYTEQVDAGQRENFAIDSYGYGLAQWTDSVRKTKLLKYARELGKSIGDTLMQLQFCIRELQSGYPMLFLMLCNSNDIDTCADRVCDTYERPSVNNYNVRRQYARQIYNDMRGSGALAAEHQEMYSTQAQYEQAAATPAYWDWKIALIQFCMQYDGYWSRPDGLKSADFFTALDQYVEDIKKVN